MFGVINMYAQAIIPQLRAIPPLYSADNEHEDWTGKTMLWMGTSVPAGSDPALGSEGYGATYPAITASKLGATCANIARGSSCVRINSSAGNYENMAYHHFLRSLSRTTAEADLAQANWDNIKVNITSAAHRLTDEKLEKMERHLSAIYSRAEKEIQKTADEYFARFANQDEAKRKLLEQGKITEEDYKSIVE